VTDQARNATDHLIHPLLARRWSPYAFEPRPLPADDLRSLFEAARWAPSSFNEQPWRYLVASREDEQAFADLLSCLVEGNRAWARHASALALGVASVRYERNGKPNSAARHDLGLASAALTVEATSRGLVVHQMGGILPDHARDLYGIPENFDPVTALAIGYAAEGEDVDEAFRQRDGRPRTRRPLEAFVFEGAWGRPAAVGITGTQNHQ
jgi:nitroreductase